jgi:PAS domain S-box-containing protein
MPIDDTPTAGGGSPPDYVTSASGRPCLVWVSSARYSDLGKFFRIEKDESVIGRGGEVDFVVDDLGVSRRHARVLRRPDGVCLLVDLSSRNGTYVNGLRIRSSPLREGDKIQIGAVTALRFSVREQLEESEERMRRALAAAGIGAFEWNAAAGTVTLSGGAERLLEAAAPDGRARTFWDTVHPDDAERVRAALQSTARAGAPCELSCRVVAAGGGIRWLELRGEVFRDESGEPTHITGAIMDVTERRQVEQELGRYALVFESLNDAVLVVDGRGEIVDWNGAAERMFGYAKSEVLGRRPGEILQPGEPDALTSTIIAEVSRTGHWSSEVGLRRKDGGECVAEGIAVPLRDPQGRHLADVVMYRDTTERKRMQARLLLADRMASLGTLAAGVAHEINNPLAFVLGNLVYIDEALSRLTPGAKLPDVETLGTAMRDAREGAERIRAIVRDLATFSRGGDPEVVLPVDVNHALEFSLKMAERHVRHRARLVKRLQEIPPVVAVESKLGQVFLNLLVNAAQAIPEGDAAHHEVRVTSSFDPGSGRVVVEVSDTGRGIAAEDLPRIFDPFFTTKPVGTGAGLGLSICHSIVTSMGGEIAVESQPGRGTTVRVTLPATERRKEASRAKEGKAPLGRARILVVDDEPLVGSVIQRLLSPAHEVIAISRAQEALSLVGAGARFDVILCDLVMPEMSGMDLYGRLLASHPAQAKRMVFMTAGAFTQGARAFVEKERGFRVVTKPLDHKELEAIIREVVEGEGPGSVVFPTRWRDAGRSE